MRKGSSARPSGSQPQATSVEREMDPRGADFAGKGGGPITECVGVVREGCCVFCCAYLWESSITSVMGNLARKGVGLGGGEEGSDALCYNIVRKEL